MNIKELASFTGKNRTTVERWCAKCTSTSIFEKIQTAHKGSPADFSIDEVEEILKSGSMSKDAVSILMKNARDQNLPAISNQIDYESIGKMIGMAVTAALTPVVDRLDKMSQAKALPEPVKEDCYTLVAYCQINKIKVNRSELALHGRQLKYTATKKGIEIKKIPDERWGTVNSYPVEILDEYFIV